MERASYVADDNQLKLGCNPVVVENGNMLDRSKRPCHTEVSPLPISFWDQYKSMFLIIGPKHKHTLQKNCPSLS